MPLAKMTKFGKRLLAEREKRQMTQAEFAQFLGTTKQAISYYERGERTPKQITALTIAKKLGIQIEEFEDEINRSNAKMIAERKLTVEEARDIDRLLAIQKDAEWIDMLISLPEPYHQQARAYLQFLSEQADKK